MIHAHMNSQRQRHNSQGLNGSATDVVLELKGEADTCPHAYLEAASKSGNYLDRKLVSSNGVSMRKQATLTGVLHAQQ